MSTANHFQNYVMHALGEGPTEESTPTVGINSNPIPARGMKVDSQFKTLIEHLHVLKFKLEKEKKMHKRKKKGLPKEEGVYQEDKSKPKDSQNRIKIENENPQKREEPTNRILMKRDDDLGTDDPEGESSCPIPQLIETIEIYKHRNAEEQREKVQLIEKYERVLRKIRKNHIHQIGQIKNNVLLDVDFLIQKYRNVSLELLQIGRKKEKEKKEENRKMTEMCIAACRKFEENVKENAKTAMQEQQTEMAKTIGDAKRENVALKKKMSELKNKMEHGKRESEKIEVKELQNQIREQCAVNDELRKSILQEKKEHEMNIMDLYSKVDLQIKTYEENIVKVFHDILLKNKIDMGMEELSRCIQVAMDTHHGQDTSLRSDMR
ncbi:conserved Plasmodium protein, unknown function [Plasmodium knowlesi strain H]|uniref:Uncharacterized protein n=3 Tax=Plasmodium knowlesi TaxID=5850 RepID=A0A5K1V660_PLAKH|nr:conserved protein, unknown function [Plasmodium knowlesi strain H]OTN64334.1 Uncharacterized protein PKNOH_S130201300 [Plasmodium knowlesi]CAA9989173.1 conserved protein, unknown function [Plasmodium knowlesi strain H]SBO27393.1 conserved Plasmodium protein, unknown function [Plasmodium knowlesi strain H]SBO27497.1 conserved Plasmodium protein, unknown function [Plasmodium knowlesi strain H]VVS78647.1 conserved protein, unknown function [Plasmodium knowlesi strain H]|eukprot:XP_002261520.1 hypothetical protein, conserved in Plasmodium species [Plasmodium knowlesi strain H]